jgi:hypothetical protein
MLERLDARLAGLDAWFARRTGWLQQRHAGGWAVLLALLLCGLLSLASGQDDGWDMRNYHLYNVHALLNGRIGFDFSPAGFQSYFNPTLELPYYYLNQWLPPRAVGFAMGVLHGLAFLLLAGIARQLLGATAPRRTVLLLAAAGMFAPGFLSELGNTMGDNLSAPPALLSLYWCCAAGMTCRSGAGAWCWPCWRPARRWAPVPASSSPTRPTRWRCARPC